MIYYVDQNKRYKLGSRFSLLRWRSSRSKSSMNSNHSLAIQIQICYIKKRKAKRIVNSKQVFCIYNIYSQPMFVKWLSSSWWLLHQYLLACFEHNWGRKTFNATSKTTFNARNMQKLIIGWNAFFQNQLHFFKNSLMIYLRLKFFVKTLVKCIINWWSRPFFEGFWS